MIPTIESRYSVCADREHRAIAGSVNGRRAVARISDSHTSIPLHGSVLSPRHPIPSPPRNWCPDPEKARQQLKLLWIGCGKKDGLIRISQGVHAYIKEKNVPHVWHVDGNAHDPTEWKNNLYLFSQRIFR